jgi:hypothetical protein
LWNAAKGAAKAAADALWRNPITRIVDCCARTAKGHAAAPPSSAMKLRPFQLIELHPLPLASVTA